MNVFLANVGNRDVALDVGDWFLTFSKGREGTDLAKHLGCGEGTRNLALQIRNNLAKYSESLRLPILGPALQAALRYAQHIHLVLLFATDQPSSAGPHRDWDTIESAKLIESLLPTLFGDQLETIMTVPVQFNASEHDRAYDFIGTTLDREVQRDASSVFASIKGGIPAMNAALRERIVQRFGPHALLIEIDEPPEGERWTGNEGRARIINSWPFRRDGVLRLLENLLTRYDYGGALRLIELEGIQASEAKVFL